MGLKEGEVVRDDLLFASLFVGGISLSQTIVPVLLYYFWAKSYVRNDINVQWGYDQKAFTGKFGQLITWWDTSWQLMAFGHIISFGLATLIWPFTYLDNDGLNRFYYYSNVFAYYSGQMVAFVSWMLVTCTGFLFPTVGALWRIHFVYLFIEIFMFACQNMLGTDAMLYYAMGH